MANYPDDNELLSLFREPSTREKGYTLLVKKYQEKLYWHIRRMVVDHDNANDVMQNVFIKVWKGLDNFREDARLLAGTVVSAGGMFFGSDGIVTDFPELAEATHVRVLLSAAWVT